MNLFAQMRGWVLAEVVGLLPGLPAEVLDKIEVTPTREAAHGDMASNAALAVAKAAGRDPRAVAAELAALLAARADVAKAEPAGPGFINITLAPELLLAQLPEILKADAAYGQGPARVGTVNVEYVSANPNGPLTVGHCRGAVVGDALANLLGKAGFAVTKEYYINDAGAQIIALARAVYVRYLEALDLAARAETYKASVSGGMQYGGSYLVPLGFHLAEEHGDRYAAAPEAEWLELFQETAVAAMRRLIDEDLAALGVSFDVFSSERALVAGGGVERALRVLEERGLIYRGVLEPPKGKTPEDWEPREQLLFKSTEFGDDVDRPVGKSDGSNTYFANDIAYHADKMARGFARMIDVWGADHGGYVKRMKAAVAALGDATVPLDIVLCQIVRVVKDGQPMRMSKRAGTFVELKDLLDEVGPDAVRFIMLMRKSDAQMEFDLNAAVAQTRDNPVFYVQYAHARCRSVLRAAVATPAVLEGLEGAELSSLVAPAEMALIRRLVAWPRMVEAAAAALEPHRIAFYLYELAGDFHALWNAGRDTATLRFLQADDPVATKARLVLVSATAAVLRSGLGVLGVRPAEEMR